MFLEKVHTFAILSGVGSLFSLLSLVNPCPVLTEAINGLPENIEYSF